MDRIAEAVVDVIPADPGSQALECPEMLKAVMGDEHSQLFNAWLLKRLQEGLGRPHIYIGVRSCVCVCAKMRLHMHREAVAWEEAAVEAKAEEEAQGEAAVEHEEEAIVVGADAEAHGEAAVDAEVEAVKAKRSWCQRRNGRGAPDSPPLRQHRPLNSHRLSALGRQGASCK